MNIRGLAILVCKILLVIAVMIALYWGVIWVLGLLGVPVPERVLTVLFVILGLLGVIGLLSGKFDTWTL